MDHAAAIVGFSHRAGHSHPVKRGIVVCEEVAEAVEAVYRQQVRVLLIEFAVFFKR